MPQESDLFQFFDLPYETEIRIQFELDNRLACRHSLHATIMGCDEGCHLLVDCSIEDLIHDFNGIGIGDAEAVYELGFEPLDSSSRVTAFPPP